MIAGPAIAYDFPLGDDAASGAVEQAMEGTAMVSRRMVLGLGAAAGGLAVAGGGTAFAYSSAMASAHALVDPSLSTVIPSRFGDLEYAEAGAGMPFLMVHCTGGGFDQGLAFARPLVDLGYRVIAPSRFGYLRTAYPEEPSSENQADAFVDLLDHLGIDKVAIAGGSAGALSAIAFAIRHPERCAALFPIVPAAYAPNRTPARPWGPVETTMAQTMLNSDFVFWLVLATMPDVVTETLLATDAEVVKAASAEEQSRVREIAWSILPVSRRTQGLLNDGRLAGNPTPMPLEQITAPTLAISAEDDRYLTADAASHIAATVTGAQLIMYPSGGHVWVGHNDELYGSIDAFLKQIGYA